jgi:hypothetical protein
MYKAMGAPWRKTSTISSSAAILLEILLRRGVLSLKRRFPMSTKRNGLLPCVDTMKESGRRARLKVRVDLVTLPSDAEPYRRLLKRVPPAIL